MEGLELLQCFLHGEAQPHLICNLALYESQRRDVVVWRNAAAAGLLEDVLTEEEIEGLRTWTKLLPSAARQFHLGSTDWIAKAIYSSSNPYGQSYVVLKAAQETRNQLPSAHEASVPERTPARPLQKTLRNMLLDSNVPMKELYLEKAFARPAEGLPPIDLWPAYLRNVVWHALNMPTSACVCYGKDKFFMFYNQQYSNIMGRKHPQYLGAKFEETWPELYPILKPIAMDCLLTGNVVAQQNATLFLETSSGLDLREIIVDWSYIPFTDDAGEFVGFANVVIEKTSEAYSTRRGAVLRDLTLSTANLNNSQAVFHNARIALEQLPIDIPFALLYSVHTPDVTLSPSVSTATFDDEFQLDLQEVVGVPASHPLAPSRIRVRKRQGSNTPLGSLWRVQDALNAPNGIYHQALAEAEVQGLERRSWDDDRVQHAAIVTACQSGGLPRAVIIVGLNSRCPFDTSYSDFLASIERRLDSSLLAVQQKQAHAQQMGDLEMLVSQRTRELQLSETRFKHFSDHSPAGLFEIARGGKIVYVNDSWRRMAGCDKPLPLQVDDYINTIAAEDRQAYLDNWRSMTNKPTYVQREWQFVGGRSCWGQAIPTGDGLLGVWVDITATKQLAQRMIDEHKQREAAAEAARAEQESFLDLCHHEIRNPLGAAMSGCQLLETCLDRLRNAHEQLEGILESLDTDSNPSIQQWLSVIGEESEEAAEVVESIHLATRSQSILANDILATSKLQGGLLSIKPVDFYLRYELDKIIQLFSPQAKASNIDLSVQFDASIPENTIVRADSTRIAQILTNLLSNSLRYLELEPGKRSCTIRAALQHHLSEVDTGYITPHDSSAMFLSVSVADSGIGISTADLNSLFTRFNTVGRQTSGSGLGLFLCRKLCQLQGGEISVKSTLGVGSDFHFYIRVAQGNSARVLPENMPLPKIDRLEISRGRMSPAGNGNTRRRLSKNSDTSKPLSHILVAEDNPITQKILKKQLERQGYRVTVVSNGRDALSLIRETKDLLCAALDKEMPYMDGVETMRQIRLLESTENTRKRLPCIALTGSASPEQQKKLTDSGIDRILTKPYSIHDLLDFIKEASHSKS